MRKILIILSVFFTAFSSCHQSTDSPLLFELDEVLGKKDVYEGYFSKQMDELKSILSVQNDPNQIYNLNKHLADAYKAHSFDSTLSYLTANSKLALSLKDSMKVMETDFMLAWMYCMAGYHVEAADILEKYDNTVIPEGLMREYIKAKHRYYGETMAYTSTEASYEDKEYRRDECRALLITMTTPDTYEWHALQREEAMANKDLAKMKEHARKMVELSQVNSHDYARACFFYHETFSEDEDLLSEEWLIRSAIADAMCAIRDYSSLNALSQRLYERGDIDRAFHYAADHCMPDALYFNGRLRSWQISRFFPQLEKAYTERSMKHMKEMNILVLIMAFCLFLLILLFIFFIKKQQILVSVQSKLQTSYMQIDNKNQELMEINNNLTVLNARIKEADKVKQEYISLFLSILSENINTTRQYKNHVLKYIRQGNTKHLIDEIESMAPIDEDISQFYKMFDEVFINLYPDFVNNFNALLTEDSAIIPKGNEILTPELRIFALIKLGITDSSKIASLLHYSANTIYNYRAKTKNKALGSREEFEAAVRAIK